jgi:FKBP-type peptidyl-prolyl cis-trans isomerase
MKFKMALVVPLLFLAACGRSETNAVEQPDHSAPVVASPESSQPAVKPVSMEITTGLAARILQQGEGDPADAGQIAVVHYTGWLYDETAENNRGKKFDSSLDRNQYFSFMLGAGRVIKGWDQGVVGMKVGEKRELTIAPEMGYGDRGAGAVIPPGATLVFEIDLAEIQGAKPTPGE